MLRSALLILSGNAAAAILQLLRNLIIARLIPLPDYGVAATFALAMSVVEMASTLGLQQQIVQSRSGDEPKFQAALQGFQLIRGLISGAALVALGGPMATVMGLPDVAWAYRLLGLVPVLNALVHFDIHRFNRRMVFAPMLLTGAMPALISVLALWPLVLWFGDWQVMLYSILLQAVLTAAMSHLLAERPWHLRFDRAVIAQSLHFGWPLLVNAVLLFLVFQGDRLIVGQQLGMGPLAVFSMGVTLTLTPTLVLAKTLQNLLLPQLSAVDRSGPIGKAAFGGRALLALEAALAGGLVTAAAVAVLGTLFVQLALGQKYALLEPLLLPLALVMGLRVFKAGPAIVALALGRTGNAVLGNLPRIAALPMAWLWLDRGGTVLDVIWIGLCAEILGFGLVLIQMRGTGRRSAPEQTAADVLPWREIVPPVLATFLAMAALLLLWVAGVSVWGSAACVLPILGLVGFFLPALRRELRQRGGFDG